MIFVKIRTQSFVGTDLRFPLPPGKYMVTGDREVTTTLTVSEKDASGVQKWSLGKGTLYDVTHLPCRSARYTPGGGTCQPTNDLELQFPVRPGTADMCLALQRRNLAQHATKGNNARRECLHCGGVRLPGPKLALAGGT